MKTAIRWIRADAKTYGLDPQRIGLWGTSAGGHLAAIAGLSPQHPQGGRERVSVDRAGVFDVARAFFAKHLR